MQMRVAVVGHVEWVTFLRVARVPAQGTITHATESWDEPAGGGSVAAAELARLEGRSAFYTALGDDLPAQATPAWLARHGVEVRAAPRSVSQRRAVTLLDDEGERTIIVSGPSLAPEAGDALDLSDLAQTDAVYFCKGDAWAVRAARQARVLVATARVLPVLQEAGVVLDALVRSARDEGERYEPGALDPPPRLVVSTEGAQGGRYVTSAGETGRWSAAPLPGPVRDAYGAGDSFAAALTWALATERSIADALAFAATRGAHALCRRGAHG